MRIAQACYASSWVSLLRCLQTKVCERAQQTGSSWRNCRALTVNACGWVVLDAQVNVLIDTETKVSCVTEVLSEQLILLDLQSTLLQGLAHLRYATPV